MKEGTIRIDALEQLISGIRESFTVYGPAAGECGVVLAELEKGRTPLLDYQRLKTPIKELFFPQEETILKSEGDAFQGVPVPEQKRVLFGVRPCDARALDHLDRVFAEGEFRDPYYTARRGNTVVLALACGEPLDTCFCTSFGGGPFDERGSDVAIFKDGDTLLFRACSSAGTSFMGEYGGHFERPKAGIAEARHKAAAKAEKKSLRLAADGLFDRLGGSLEPDFWDTRSRRCLSCGICAYLCPTCHCFAFSDRSSPAGTERTRTWDACNLELFTREASGHNPRSAKAERMKQRIMHKFRYTVENFGSVFCVGCGRCVGNCPVNVDLRELIGELMR